MTSLRELFTLLVKKKSRNIGKSPKKILRLPARILGKKFKNWERDN